MKFIYIRTKSKQYKMTSYVNKTRNELIVLCKEQNIKGYSHLKKDDLIKLLNPNASITNAIPISSYKFRMIDLFAGTGAFSFAF